MEYKAQLEAQPGWKWTARTSTQIFSEGAFLELRKYVALEGHATVPKGYMTKDGFRLGGWVQSQRSQFDRLTLEDRAQLEALPGWTWNALSDRWEDGFRHLSDFAQREGHAGVKQGFVAEDGYRLGSWAQNQRARREKISKERAARLETLPGWRWIADSLQWDDWINLLKESDMQNLQPVVS